VGQGVAAHVDEDDQVHAKRGSRGGNAVHELRRAKRRVHEYGLLGEQLGHPRLREEHPGLTHARSGRGRHDTRCQPPRALDLRLGARPRLRIDRSALPGDTAHQGLRAMDVARLGSCERAHHVAAPADPQHQRPPGAGQELLGVDHAAEPIACAIDSG
jgi:hypothetical protein